MSNNRRDINERLKQLDSLLQTKPYTKQEIQEHLGVGSTSVKNFLKKIKDGECWSEYAKETFSEYFLGEKNIIKEEVIDGNGTKQYSYSVQGFSIRHDKLTEDVIEKLLPFIEVIDQMYGLDDIINSVTDSLLDIISKQNNRKYQEQIKNLRENKFHTMRISMQEVMNINSGELEDLERMKTIRKAIINKEVIIIKYQPFNQPISTITCHPYLIVESASRWKMICKITNVDENDSSFIERLNKINVISMEKIVDKIVIKRNAIFENYSNQELNKLLKSSAGPSISDWENPKRMNIKLKIDENLLDYFKTKHFLEKGQTIDGNHLLLKNAIYTIELRSKILRFGSSIEVIEPLELRKILKDEINKMHSMY